VDLKATTVGRAAKAGRAASVIGVASGIGARDRRCGEGPPRLIAGGLLERLTARGADVVIQAILRPHYLTLYRAISDLSIRLAREVALVLESGRFPLVLGGDHSCAIGTWSGVASALARRASDLPAGWLGIEHEVVAPTELPARGRVDALAVIETDHELTRHVILIDTPDHDGDQPQHPAQADPVVRCGCRLGA
jgi:hypothetical protein